MNAQNVNTSSQFSGNESCSDVVNLTDTSRAILWLFTATDYIVLESITPLVSIFGVGGNLVFLWMVYRIKTLHTNINVYLTNLAICDIMFLLFRNGYGIALARKNDINRSYPVESAFGCAMWVITTRLWCMASVMFTTIVTIERYLAICYPLKHMMLKGTSRNIKLISLIWIVCLLAAVSIVPRFVSYKTYCLLWPDSEKYQNMPMVFHTCYPHESFPYAGAYEGILIMVVLILAMVFNSVLFYLIIRALNERSQAELQEAKQNQIAFAIDRVRNQVARTLVANGIIFFLCQIPYRVYSLDDIADELHLDITFLDERQEINVLNIGRLFLLLNSTINPYFYLVGCKHYRVAFWKAFRYSAKTAEMHSSTGKSMETVT